MPISFGLIQPVNFACRNTIFRLLVGDRPGLTGRSSFKRPLIGEDQMACEPRVFYTSDTHPERDSRPREVTSLLLHRLAGFASRDAGTAKREGCC